MPSLPMSETRGRLSFLRTRPLKNPRTEWRCQPVLATMSSMVTPDCRRSIWITRSCLLFAGAGRCLEAAGEAALGLGRAVAVLRLLGMAAADAHVLEFVEGLGTGGREFGDMAPVHEHVVDGAVDRVVSAQAERVLEKGLELGGCHFAGSADKLAPLNAASTAGIALDFHIVGRVVDAHFGDLALHQLRVGSLITGVTNQEPVATQLKDGAFKGDRWPFGQSRRVVGGIGDVGLQTVEHGIDLC